MRLSFTQSFAFLFVFIGAVSARTPGRRVYTSAQKEGAIGVTAANPTDNHR
jgi:hypothetical protein